MLGLRLTIDCQPRSKKGIAAHSTTGVASTNSIHTEARSPIQSLNGRPSIGLIASTNTGSASTALTHRRRVKSTSSGFGLSAPVGTPIGSSAMPQIGQEPGPSRTISGCIGQVYFVPAGAGFSAGRSPRYFAGSASNFPLQPAEQK